MPQTFFHTAWSRRWLSWAVALTGFAVFLVVAHELSELRAGGGTFFQIDQGLLETFSAYRGPFLTRIALIVTTLGSPTFLTLLVLVSVFYSFQKKDRLALAQLAAGVLGGVLLNFGLKLFFQRLRPELIPHLASETGFSFPSGHATGAASVYFTLALIGVERMTRRNRKVGLLAATSALVVAIAITRLYLGVHYPSDVFAGIAIGGGWAFFIGAIAEEMKLRRKL